MALARTTKAAAVTSEAVSRPDLPIYPELGFTKADLARHYEAVAKWMLPHVHDRPTGLVRCFAGVGRHPCRYDHHDQGWATPEIRTVLIPGQQKVGEYAYVRTAADLVKLVDIGVVEVHTWNARVTALDRPDRLVFDLDPGAGIAWEQVTAAALRLRELLDEIRLQGWPKTTGGDGLHVVVPLRPGCSWEDGLEVGRTIARILEREDPSLYTTTMGKTKRVGRIYVDYLRNIRAGTSIAAFSARARPGGAVSVPLAWKEIGRVRSNAFTVQNVVTRLRGLRSDPWEGYWTARQTVKLARRVSPAAPKG